MAASCAFSCLKHLDLSADRSVRQVVPTKNFVRRHIGPQIAVNCCSFFRESLMSANKTFCHSDLSVTIFFFCRPINLPTMKLRKPFVN